MNIVYKYRLQIVRININITYHNTGHDVNCEFRTGFSCLMDKDSEILRSGWSFVGQTMLTSKGMSSVRVRFKSACRCLKWSPRGVSGVWCRMSRMCSLKRSRIGRLVSPTYVTFSSVQSVHLIRYTKFLSVHLPFSPHSQQ